MVKVLIATGKPFAREAVEEVEAVFADVDFEVSFLEEYKQKSGLLDAVKDANALIVRSDQVDEEVIAAAEALKIIVRAGAGYDNIDLDAASQRGIVVMNTPGQNSNAVAELAFGLILFAARNGFNGKAGFELRGKNFGIHGFGHIGAQMGRIARGFEMQVAGFGRSLTTDKAAKNQMQVAAGLEALYRNNQIVSVNVPLSEETHELIGYELMMAMPKNAILVNTARKEVICEGDLFRVLRTRNDFTYVADVAPDRREELEKLFPERVVFTAKKMGAQTAEANLNAGVAAASQIVGFFHNHDTTFQVNSI